MIVWLLNASRLRLLPLVAALVALIAVADWAVGNRMSLGVLYVLPMMLGSIALAPAQIVLLAIVCSSLRSTFDLPSPYIEMLLRFLFALIAYSASGLVVAALIRNRKTTIEHLDRIDREQALRHDAEELLRILVEGSPAAILTVGPDGVVIAANSAANQMFMLPDAESLKGRSIAAYLPVLSDALQLEPGVTSLRTAAQSQGYRANGEIFLANIWLSSYSADGGKRLAAIVVDSSEEMREHEEENLRELMRGNRIAASAVSHEIRNLCSAIAVVSMNLGERHKLAADDEFMALDSLVRGLEKVSSHHLHSAPLPEDPLSEDPQSDAEERGRGDLQDLPLQVVLDDLRIVIESGWREIDGIIHWSLPAVTPRILADRHGLLQAFLNLAQNSHRAVQQSPVRELRITVESDQRSVIVRFHDSGPGIASPDRLFEPFQPGADGSGLGLYVSRAVVRGYGGELRHEPQPAGSCFAVELQAAPPDDIPVV